MRDIVRHNATEKHTFTVRGKYGNFELTVPHNMLGEDKRGLAVPIAAEVAAQQILRRGFVRRIQTTPFEEHVAPRLLTDKQFVQLKQVRRGNRKLSLEEYRKETEMRAVA